MYTVKINSKINSKDQAILDIFYAKESSNLTGWENFGLKLKKKTVKLLEKTNLAFLLINASSMDAYLHAKMSIIAQFSCDILQV